MGRGEAACGAEEDGVPVASARPRLAPCPAPPRARDSGALRPGVGQHATVRRGRPRPRGQGRGPRRRPGLGSENRAAWRAGSLRPIRLPMEVGGRGGGRRVTVEAKSSFPHGGRLALPDAFAGTIFTSTDEHLTRVGAGTWPRWAAGLRGPGTGC